MKHKIYKAILLVLLVQIICISGKNAVNLKESEQINSLSSIDNSMEIKDELPAESSNSKNDVATASTNNSSKSSLATITSAATTINSNIKGKDGFALLKDLDNSLQFDIRYATTNNFTHTAVYDNDICVLRTETAKKVVAANQKVKAQGYCLKIYDAYRPISVQKKFWSIMPNDNYVANPYAGGSIHNKGCAVDLTMVDLKTGKEVEMPSDFDDFTEKAWRSSNMTSNTRKNLEILTNAMVESGMTTINTEWWHFEDTDKNKYSISDVDLNLFK